MRMLACIVIGLLPWSFLSIQTFVDRGDHETFDCRLHWPPIHLSSSHLGEYRKAVVLHWASLSDCIMT